MKRLLLLWVLAFSVSAMHADEFPYLAFQTTEGTITALSVEGLTLSYADGTLTVTNTETSKTFSTASLSQMYFTDTATGIAALTADGMAGNASVEAITTDGRSAGRFDSLQQAASKLPKGVYVIKAENGTTIKISIQ